MTTIAYKEGGKSAHASDPLSLMFSYTSRLVSAWQRRQAERELESMPLDARKDIGWPSAAKDNRKAAE